VSADRLDDILWDAMALGLGRLRLAPRDFWGMTLREFRAAQDGLAGRTSRSGRRGMSRERLAELMEKYPDGG